MNRAPKSRTPKEPVPEGGFPPAPADLGHELIRGFAGRLIRRKSRQLVGRFHLTATDRADIEQDLRMLVFRRRDHFDPMKGHWKAFVIAVVDGGVANLLEARRCQKAEHNQEIISLSTKVRGEDDEQVELSRTILPEHKSALTGRYSLSDHEQIELKHDVDVVLAKLPPELRELAELLKTKTISEITRELGLSRSSLMEKVYKLRAIFARHDLTNSV